MEQRYKAMPTVIADIVGSGPPQRSLCTDALTNALWRRQLAYGWEEGPPVGKGRKNSQ
jgi:hypothetical protein